MTERVSASLDEHHALDSFDCGAPSLNTWLTSHAINAKRRGSAQTHVWTMSDSDRVVAYYAITPTLVARKEVSSKDAGDLDSIPGYLIAKLALDQSLHRERLGSELLVDALYVIVKAAEQVSGRLIVVDALDEQAASFYSHHDFKPVKENPLRLTMKMATARKHVHP